MIYCGIRLIRGHNRLLSHHRLCVVDGGGMITAAALLRRPSPPHQVSPPVFTQLQRPVPRQRHLVAAERPGVALGRTHPRRDRTGLGRQEVVHFDLKPLLRVAHAMPDVTRVARGQVHDVGVVD